MKRARRLLKRSWVPRLLGNLLAGYLALVHRTSRITWEPADATQRAVDLHPAIFAMWHGQHFMVPFVRPKAAPSCVMISQSRDAEVNAVAAERLGLVTIRASGSHRSGDIRRKRGMVGFREMMRALEEGLSTALTADVPKVARQAGKGIVLLAKHSGRPILPVAYASSRNIDFDSWDRASLCLPFSRAGVVLGEPIFVPADADEEEIERCRIAVTDGLNRATDRAYELAGVVSKFRGEAGHG